MQEENQIVVGNKAGVAAQLRSFAKQIELLAGQVESGAISRFQLTQEDSSITFTADSADGCQRVIKAQTHAPGLYRERTEHIQKQDPSQRRQLVKTLVAEGMTQTEIAKRTIRFQKTICNDIKKLREDGEL